MLRLSALGGYALLRDGVPVDGLSDRRLAFLSALACAAPDRGVSRDRLLLLFWPEKNAEQGKNALKQLTFALRRDLSVPELFIVGNELRLNPTAIVSDVGELLRAAASAEHEAVVAAYKGSLLDGLHLSNALEFHEWLDEERRRIDRIYRASLHALVEQASAEGTGSDRIRLLRLLADHDPLDSDLVLQLIDALAASGRMTDALRIARQFETNVRRELGVAPDARFIEAVSRLNLPRSEAVARVSSAGALVPPPSGPRTRLRLKRRLSFAALGVGVGAIVALGFFARRQPRVARTIGSEREFTALERFHGPRGRIVIERPINQTGDPALDSLGDRIANLLRTVVTSSNNAILVPPDTVDAIQRESANLALNTPVQRLPRANAAINVMTVYSMRHDSLRIVVWLQRLVTGPQFSGPDFDEQGHRRPPKIVSGPSLETWPLGEATAPLAQSTRAIIGAAGHLNTNLQAMRSCDANLPGRKDLVAWCWVADNQPDVVPGYFKRVGFKR